MKRFVIDASVLLKLFFLEPHSDICAKHVAKATDILAPDLIWSECANVIWKRHRRGEVSSPDAEALIQDMLRMPVQTHASPFLIGSTLTLACTTGRTVYDCVYLALAVQSGCPLLTADERLANALGQGVWTKHVRFVGTL